MVLGRITIRIFFCIRCYTYFLFLWGARLEFLTFLFIFTWLEVFVFFLFSIFLGFVRGYSLLIDFLGF
jgi:hypothetical protein